MRLKSTAKKVLPVGVFERAKKIANGSLSLYSMALAQAHRYNKAYAKYDSRGVQQITARMVFFTHQIEKGLSHTNFRYGFGHKPLQYLNHAMERYRQANPEYMQSIMYQSALAALHEYRQRHEGHEAEFEYAKNLFPSSIWEEVVQFSLHEAGSIAVTSASKEDNGTLPFSELSEHRHSIREYSDEPVTLDELMPTIELAMRTPSVCNRQPSRVRVILDSDTIEQALRIQGGFGGYPIPPALILITADNRSFMTPQEHNEGFTDGGLFGMSLLLALEEAQLAACPLNTMFRPKAEKATRKLLDIPECENLVMYIAVGHFPESVKTCRSERLLAEDITTVID